MFNLKIADYKQIVILTGAGVSAASGLKPYRGENGKNDSDIEKRACVDRLNDNPLSIWEAFNSLRKKCQQAKPNQAHIVLANLEASLKPDQKFTLITQNIDRLHHQAGSKNIIELHGRIDRTCCSNPKCDLESFLDNQVYWQQYPICSQCDSPLKPDVVLFGESIPLDAEWQVKKALRNCDLFIAIGTSGTVFTAASYVRSAEYVGAKTILVNLELMRPKNPYFQKEYLGKAEEILSNLFVFN